MNETTQPTVAGPLDPTVRQQLHGLDDLREWLEAQGFRTAVDSLGGRDNQCNWYAYKSSTLPARECECNDGKPMQLVVRPFKYAFSPPRAWESVEVDVSGEAGGVWFKLQAYSLTLSELRSKLPEIEARLIAAWNSLLPNVRDQAGVQRVNDVLADMERRKAEHDAAVADAARFRWLDEVALSVDMVADPDNLVQVWHETLSGHATTGRTLREAVDEAMKRHNASLGITATRNKMNEPKIDGYPLWSGLPPPEPRIHYEGPVAFHTQRCAVLPGQHAVLDLNAGVFRPSWEAQAQGWRLVRADTWLRRLALRLFGDA